MKKNVLHHECVAGVLNDHMIKIIGVEKGEYIGNVNFVLGEGKRMQYHIQGQVLLIEPRNYDYVAFALLRSHFGLPFPQLLIVDYVGNLGYQPFYNGPQAVSMTMILTRRFPDRELCASDYTPNTPDNFIFRYNLCLLIYFCKFIACNFSLQDVRVWKGVPFIWRCHSLGYKRAKTISKNEFSYFFGVAPEIASQIVCTYNSNERDPVLTDADFTNFEAEPEIKPEHLRGTMFEMVIDHFRNVNFDKDYIRECLYIRENPIRHSKGNRRSFPLSRDIRDISALMEENFTILSGSYPYRIFSH